MTTDEKLNKLIDLFIRWGVDPKISPSEYLENLKKIKAGEEIKKEFDPTKPVQTRDGRKARIICTDRKDEYPLVVLLEDENGCEELIEYSSKGKFWNSDTESVADLINI